MRARFQSERSLPVPVMSSPYQMSRRLLLSSKKPFTWTGKPLYNGRGRKQKTCGSHLCQSVSCQNVTIVVGHNMQHGNSDPHHTRSPLRSRYNLAAGTSTMAMSHVLAGLNHACSAYTCVSVCICVPTSVCLSLCFGG